MTEKNAEKKKGGVKGQVNELFGLHPSISCLKRLCSAARSEFLKNFSPCGEKRFLDVQATSDAPHRGIPALLPGAH